MTCYYYIMLKLSSLITELPRIGPAKAKSFQKLGATYVRDLLFTFPRRYDDFSNVTPIKDLEIGQQVSVRGRIKSTTSKWGFQGRRRLLRIFADIKDDTGVLSVTWYNLRFLEQQLIEGREMYVAGKIEPGPSMHSPAMEFVNSKGDQTHTASITPIYSETAGVSSRFIRYQVKNLLSLTKSIPEYIPLDIIEENELLDIHTALRAIHFPKDKKELAAAERRLRFDELFFLQLAALVRRQDIQKAAAHPIKITSKKISELSSGLPFKLTRAQNNALQDIAYDMQQAHPMNRLLQGDVGAGKSAVALIAAQLALAKGYKVLYLAPTEILARQQAQSFAKALGEREVHLLIGALPAPEKKHIKHLLTQGEPTCVIGTHALLQDDVVATKVGLVIIDEQHRFGVAQRAALKKVQPDIEPHLLSMTATPIPRTLNLTVYGDLDVSVLDELPPGRKPVKTKVITPGNREQAIIHVLEELTQGHQGYIIAPLVEKSDKLEAKSAKETYAEMKKLFPGIAIGLIHGQMPSEEKESVMRSFAAGALQLLVSTSVVEVGVNVPNATIMIIEGAERFGLSQLHQFRGRIGRGRDQSFCYLFPTSKKGANAERLGVLAATNDGFKIAEEDLRLRGPGEVYGVSQSGFGNLKVASLLDYPTIKLAREEAEKILEQDHDLNEHPILQAKVRQKNLINHFE